MRTERAVLVEETAVECPNNLVIWPQFFSHCVFLLLIEALAIVKADEPGTLNLPVTNEILTVYGVLPVHSTQLPRRSQRERQRHALL